MLHTEPSTLENSKPLTRNTGARALEAGASPSIIIITAKRRLGLARRAIPVLKTRIGASCDSGLARGKPAEVRGQAVNAEPRRLGLGAVAPGCLFKLVSDEKSQRLEIP